MAVSGTAYPKSLTKGKNFFIFTQGSHNKPGKLFLGCFSKTSLKTQSFLFSHFLAILEYRLYQLYQKRLFLLPVIRTPFPLGMKIFFHYYKALHAFNLPFSLFLGVAVGMMLEDKLAGFFALFFFSYVLVGLGLAFYFFWLRNPEQYYFYQNRGWSILWLIGLCFLVNLSLYLGYCLSKPFLYGH